MPKIDSISTTPLIDSVQSAFQTPPIVVHDTIYKTLEKAVSPESSDDAIQFVSHNFDNSIPALLILGLLVIAIGLFLTFQVLTKYIAPYLQSHYKIKRPYLLMFRVKTISWMIFTIFSFYQLVSSHIIIGFGLTIFITLLGINFWKDFFAGIYIKFEGRLKPNDFITINDKKGNISQFHTRNFELKNENNEVFIIPFHKLLQSSVAKRINKGEERSRTIHLTVPIESPYNSIKAIEKLLHICPWVYSHKANSVKKTSNTEFAVSIFAGDNFTFQKVEAFLQQHIQNDSND